MKAPYFFKLNGKMTTENSLCVVFKLVYSKFTKYKLVLTSDMCLKAGKNCSVFSLFLLSEIQLKFENQRKKVSENIFR